MRFSAFVLPALVAASPLIPTQEFKDGPDPKDIQIVNASFSGNGCPQGTVVTSISPDKTVSLSLGGICHPVKRNTKHCKKLT